MKSCKLWEVRKDYFAVVCNETSLFMYDLARNASRKVQINFAKDETAFSTIFLRDFILFARSPARKGEGTQTSRLYFIGVESEKLECYHQSEERKAETKEIKADPFNPSTTSSAPVSRDKGMRMSRGRSCLRRRTGTCPSSCT